MCNPVEGVSHIRTGLMHTWRAGAIHLLKPVRLCGSHRIQRHGSTSCALRNHLHVPDIQYGLATVMLATEVMQIVGPALCALHRSCRMMNLQVHARGVH